MKETYYSCFLSADLCPQHSPEFCGKKRIDKMKAFGQSDWLVDG
jgi:hypothetical protein